MAGSKKTSKQVSPDSQEHRTSVHEVGQQFDIRYRVVCSRGDLVVTVGSEKAAADVSRIHKEDVKRVGA